MSIEALRAKLASLRPEKHLTLILDADASQRLTEAHSQLDGLREKRQQIIDNHDPELATPGSLAEPIKPPTDRIDELIEQAEAELVAAEDAARESAVVVTLRRNDLPRFEQLRAELVGPDGLADWPRLSLETAKLAYASTSAATDGADLGIGFDELWEALGTIDREQLRGLAVECYAQSAASPFDLRTSGPRTTS